MNQFNLESQGSWETTVFTNHGGNVQVAEVFLQISAGRDELGSPAPGGLTLGGEMAAYLRLSNIPEIQQPLFPGTLRLALPGGELLIQCPLGMDLSTTNVLFNGQDITQNILELQLQLDIDQNVMGGSLVLYQAAWFGPDQIQTFTLL